MATSAQSKIQLNQDDPTTLKAWIKAQALALGFSDCVIAKPDAQAELPRFKEYLKRGYHGDMKFLEENIEKSLHELNMEKSKFKVNIENDGTFYDNGMDKVEFLISTNPGEPLKPLVKIASGGELSRVMLAIKSILADSDGVDTMIFDEIDTGVSGKAAMSIAKKLAVIAKNKQVICITHLPQLTAMADNHYLIQKNTDGEMASTTLKELDEEGRELELARIIDGGEVTELALSHAKQMLENAKNN
mgnify:CR=1 FL=1